MKISIYFAGTIAKDGEVMESMWTNQDLDNLQDYVSPFPINFMNPAERNDNVGDPKSVFGRDMVQIFLSDIVFVDGRHRRGIGVGAEMMWAKFLAKPLIILVPEESYYKRSNIKILGKYVDEYIHPFVESLCDKVVTNLEEAAKWIIQYMKKEVGMIKDLSTVYDLMQYYRDSQFNNDNNMKELINSSSAMLKQFESIPECFSYNT